MEGNRPALAALQRLVTRPDKQEYKVWEDGYLAKAIWTPNVLDQKLAYIHDNPVQPHWRLADAPEGYGWSSARFYLQGEPALIPLRDVGELLA